MEFKRVGKRLKQILRRFSPTSSDEELDMEPEVPAKPFEKSLILIGKKHWFVDFTIEAPAFHRGIFQKWDEFYEVNDFDLFIFVSFLVE